MTCEEEPVAKLKGQSQRTLQRSDYNTSYEGSYITLCDAAKTGDSDAIAHLWGVLFPQAMVRLSREFDDDTVVEDLATEVVDKYLLGWINSDEPRGTGKPGPVAAGISSCVSNYKGHWEQTLENFVASVYIKRVSQDPVVAGRVTYDYTRPGHEDQDPDGDQIDEVETEAQALPDHRPVNDPAFVIEKKELYDKFRTLLTERQQVIFDYLLEGYTEGEIAGILGVTDRTVRRDKQDIKQELKQWMNSQK